MEGSGFEYFVVSMSHDYRAGWIKRFGKGIKRNYELSKGVRMKDNFPPTVEIGIDEDSGDMLTDIIPNIGMDLIVSEKVKKILESEGLVESDTLEYLPFVLKGKRGRVVKEQYFFVNSFLKIDCLDREKSDFSTYSGSDEVCDVNGVYLLLDKVPEKTKLFRLGEYASVILLRSDLVERLNSEGVTGLSVVGMGVDLFDDPDEDDDW